MADMTLNYHLMHPGGESLPGDPNAAFHIDGVYHLHYILNHPWRGLDRGQTPKFALWETLFCSSGIIGQKNEKRVSNLAD